MAKPEKVETAVVKNRLTEKEATLEYDRRSRKAVLKDPSKPPAKKTEKTKKTKKQPKRPPKESEAEERVRMESENTSLNETEEPETSRCF